MIAVFQEMTYEGDCGNEFRYDQLVTVFDTQLQVGNFLNQLGKKAKEFSYLEIEKGVPLPGTGFSFVSVYDVNWMDGTLGKLLRSGYEKRDLPCHQWMLGKDEIPSLKLGDKVNGIHLHQPGYDPALAQEHVDLIMMTLKVNRLRVSLGEVVKLL